ncbi:MAG: sterol desaturase family protein [Deltaproteobacteria bacterium]|nr:sterol desaturase family protein [Deltaproteobacteria bacterium]
MSKAEIFWLSFSLLGAAFSAVEQRWPSRKRESEATLPADAASFFLYQLFFYPFAVSITDRLIPHLHYPSELLQVPLAIRVVVAYLVADLGSYWMHRLMHTKHIWRIHKWHHSPTVMYWLAGVRATIPQQILFNLPYVFVVPLLSGAPRWIFLVMMVHGLFQNNFMHMNTTWRSNVLEWFIVTPRYHHIHHSVDITTHGGNYGALFTFWDRIFKTYRNPDEFTPEAFGTGTGDTDAPERLIVGF